MATKNMRSDNFQEPLLSTNTEFELLSDSLRSNSTMDWNQNRNLNECRYLNEPHHTASRHSTSISSPDPNHESLPSVNMQPPQPLWRVGSQSSSMSDDEEEDISRDVRSRSERSSTSAMYGPDDTKQRAFVMEQNVPSHGIKEDERMSMNSFNSIPRIQSVQHRSVHHQNVQHQNVQRHSSQFIQSVYQQPSKRSLISNEPVIRKSFDTQSVSIYNGNKSDISRREMESDIESLGISEYENTLFSPYFLSANLR